MEDRHDPDFDDEPDPWEEDGWYDCGLGEDGQCSKAGTEECDWLCGGLCQ